MKRAIIPLICLVILVASSCEAFYPIEITPVVTPLPPTMTPDPCGPESLSDKMMIINQSLTEFQEVVFIADNSRVQDLISPLMKLEEIRIRLSTLSTPSCLAKFKQSYLDYTAVVIRYLSSRMNDSKSDDYEIDQQNSQTLWQVVELEYEKAILDARLDFQTLTSSDSAFAQAAEIGVMARNDGTRSVNVRAQADLDASIVGSLEPGMQALVIARNEAGDWVRINLMGIYGWVFTKTIDLSAKLDEIPVTDNSQN